MNAFILWWKALQLRFMLWMLGWMLYRRCKNSAEFRALLDDKDVILQFGTVDEKVARHYIVKNNVIISGGGIHPQASMALSFSDAPYAVGTLMSRDQMLFMTGVQQQKITLTGDAGLLMWFMTLMQQLKPPADAS